MKPTFAFLIMFILSLYLHCNEVSTETALEKYKVRDNDAFWENLCKYLVQIMSNSDVARKGNVKVMIFMIGSSSWSRNYEGFHRLLHKISGREISMSFRVQSFDSILYGVYADYVIFLTEFQMQAYQAFIDTYLVKIFPDKSTRFIVILRNWYNYWDTIRIILNHVVKNGYGNLYEIIIDDTGKIYIYRSTYNSQSNLLKINPRETDSYLTSKDLVRRIRVGKIRIQIIFCDFYPFSYVKNGQIIGSDGILLKELSKKLNIEFDIVNRDNLSPRTYQVIEFLKHVADVCLCTKSFLTSGHFYGAWLYDQDGLCLITPRNIPVSVYEIFSLPFDRPTTILIVISIILMIVSWKVIAMQDKDPISLMSIIVNVLLLTLNSSASGIENASLKLKFIIYSFLVGSFIMISFYESAILSLMLTESSMRSAASFEELNETNTRFFSYFSMKRALFFNLPAIRDDMIVSRIDLKDLNSLELPHELNENLAYTVSCKYADFFLTSSRNYREGRQLFDKMVINLSYQRYTFSSKFLFKDEFSKMVEVFYESGIRSFLMRKSVEELPSELRINSEELKHTGRQFVEFQDMMVPIVVCLIGSLISLAVFVVELVVKDDWMIWLRNKTSTVNNNCCKRRKKLDLRKWMKKYQSKRNMKWKREAVDSNNEVMFIKINRKRENIKNKESTENKFIGGYLAFGKYKVGENKLGSHSHQTVVKYVRRG